MKKENLIKSLNYIINKHTVSDDPDKVFKISAYKRAITIVSLLPNNVKKEDVINSTLTNHMKDVCLEFISGEKSIEKSTLLEKLITIQGVKKATADKLINLGLTKLQDLKKKEFFNLLSEETKAFITMQPNTSIPYNYIKENIEPIIKGKITGSFRRKKDICHDVDVVVTTDKDKYLEYINKIMSKVVIYLNGSEKTSMLVKYKSDPAIKLDIFFCKKEDEAAMLLYSTGSKEFNKVMRAKAKSMGYLLNQKGLFKNDKQMRLKTEKEYFDALKMEYQPAEDRI